jgi:hypothetical protein
MVTWRYDKLEDLPATMREYVETEAPFGALRPFTLKITSHYKLLSLLSEEK